MMQFNICAKVTPLLKEKGYDIPAKKITEFLNTYKKGEYIYPGVLHRKFKVDIKTVYAILEICADENLLAQRFGVYCPECQRYTGYIYKNLGELPGTLGCPHCDNEIQNVLHNALVIYEVL